MAESEICVPVTFDPTEDVTSIGFFAVVSVFVGIVLSILQQQIRWITLPFSFMVFTVGMAISAISVNAHLGVLDSSIENWRRLNPEILLFMFLPPLLFTSAFVVEYHVFRRLIWQAILLATVGVLISVLLTAGVAVLAFGYGWGLGEGLLLGAVFGATDPVAVVALLHELGAPETLSVLIEGESLLNDGVGFVLFLVFFDQLSGRESYTTGEVFGKVAYSSFAGLAIGIGGGIVALLLLQRVWSDLVVAVAITVGVVWACFFASELGQVSGVISVVALGIFLAAFSDGYINVSVGQGLKRFWHKVEYLANTLVFMYSGVVVINVLLDADNTYSVSSRDVSNLILLFVALNLIRALAVTVQFYALSKMGYGMTKPRAAVLAYSGLRGAVGLIGALLVVEECSCAPGEVGSPDSPCLDFEYKNQIVFFMAGIVLLTMAVNGTTTKYLVNYFKLNKQDDVAKRYFVQATMNLEDHLDDVVESLKRHPHYRTADWDEVWQHVPILSLAVLQERKRMGIASRDSFIVKKDIDRIARERFVLVESGSDSDLESVARSLAAEAEQGRRLAEARYRFLSLVKASYRHQFAEGASTSWPTLQVLIEATNRAQDRPEQPIREWEDSIDSVANPQGWLSWVLRPLDLSWSQAKRTGTAYEIVSTFVRAHKSAITAFNRLSDSMERNVMVQVLEENNQQILKAVETIERIERHHPAISQRVKTNITTQRVLKEMETYSYTMLSRALIDEKDLHTIKQALEDSRKSLKKNLMVHKPPTLVTVLRNSPLFFELDDGLVKRFVSQGETMKFNHGDTIHSRGTPWDGVYLIYKGHVSIEFMNKSNGGVVDCPVDDSTESVASDAGSESVNDDDNWMELSSGDVIGVVELISKSPYVGAVTCNTRVEVLRIPNHVMEQTMEDSEVFEHNVMREAGLVILNRTFPQFQFATFNLLKSVLPHARVISGHHTRHLGQFARALRQGSISHLLTSKSTTEKKHHSFSLKPVAFHGGLVIGLSGKIQTAPAVVHEHPPRGHLQVTASRGTKEVTGSVMSLPLFTPVRPTVPLALSADANLLHLSADALAVIEDFSAFEEVEEDPTKFLAEKAKGRRARIRGRKVRRRIDSEEISRRVEKRKEHSASILSLPRRLLSLTSNDSRRSGRRRVSTAINEPDVEAEVLHDTVNVMIGEAPDSPEI